MATDNETTTKGAAAMAKHNEEVETHAVRVMVGDQEITSLGRFDTFGDAVNFANQIGRYANGVLVGHGGIRRS